ncbi:rho GTPase-activating protein 18-like isoform X3 [Sycon ciliatum]|uniref:rho GTPase-activating protein 18-like isoform X3 n=1 Tax=Sycon ciliatum TaxID=27933 RepID=UPI0020A913B3|eukprot:scpid17418/ scgid1307/ Rho GTPase-activating protein 18; MacGAP; Rho-type GTPase-activating protein 18
MTSESNACQLVGQPLRSHGNHNGHDLLCQQQREQIDGGRRSTQCHSGGLSTLEDLAPPRPRPRADSHQSQKQQHMHRRVKRFGWRSSCYATAAALKDEDRTRTSSCVALYTKGLHMFRMGDRELKGAEPVLTSFQRSHSPMNPADDMASKPRKRTSGLKASSASPRGSHTLPSPSSTAAMTSHDLKASRKNMPLRLRQSELEATARSLASCRHYPIQYPGNARTADAKTSTTLQPITPRTAAASANEFSWEDYWEERKQIEKSASPAEDKETDIDEDINERNKEIDISKVRERTQTMKLTAADAAAIMKQVKRINASVKTSPSTSSSSIGTGDHPAVNGKASHGREPDKEPDKELSSSTSALESSAESDQRRGSAAESTVLSQSEYFVCVSGNADTVDPSVPLPELELGREALGVTYMHDLSEADQGKICHVVVLALTALLDTYDLRWKTGRPLKRKGMDVKDAKSKIFGVPLTSMMERDRGLQESITCPLFFTEICDFLVERGATEEGILRKPGSESRMKKLREELEDVFCEGRFSWQDRFPHDCATLLKQFLRELPVALLTEEYLPMFETIEHIPSRRVQLMVLNLLTLLIPPVHRACLKVLLQKLYQITTFEDKNRMGLSSVAMIIAPNLFRHRPCTDPTNEAKIAARESYITQLLMVYHDLLFVVPNTLLEQLRLVNEAEAVNSRKTTNMKAVKKVLSAQQQQQQQSRKHDSPTPTPTTMGKERKVLKVFTPQSSRVSYVMEISDTTTAGDILIQFCKKQFGVTSPTFETGTGSLENLTDRRKSHTPVSASSLSLEDVRSGSLSSSSDTLRSNTPEQSPLAYDVYECYGNVEYRRVHEEALIREVHRANPTGSIAIAKCGTSDLAAVLKTVMA